MLPTQRCCLSFMLSPESSTSREAQDAVERRAQLVAHGGEEVALEAVRLVQGHVRLGQLVHLAVEVGVDLAPLVLHADEVAQHAVEGMAEVLELVAGLDFAADVELAGGDGVGDFLEVLDRLDDDVAHDDPAADHDEDGRGEGGGHEHGAVPVDAFLDAAWSACGCAPARRRHPRSAARRCASSPTSDDRPCSRASGGSARSRGAPCRRTWAGCPRSCFRSGRIP